MKRLLSILLLAACLPLGAQTPAPAPTPTSLDDYLVQVAGHSLELRSSAARTEAAAQLAAQARTGYLPRLSLDGDFSLAARRHDDRRRWDFSLLPQLVQTLYAGGGVRAGVRHADLEHDIARCEEEFSHLEVRFAAERAYWNLSAMNLFVDAMRRYVDLIRSLKQIVDRRFDEGYIAKGDVLMIDARLSEAEYELVSAEQHAAVALHNFNILRGADAELPVTLCCDIRDSIAMPVRVEAQRAVSQRPDFEAARLRVEQTGAAVRSARAAFNPQVSVGIGGSWQPHSPNRTGSTFVDGVAFLKLSVPIFHGGERRRAVAAARAVQLGAEWSAAQTYDDIMGQEMNGWTALVQSRAQVDSSERSLRIAGENLELSTYSYGEGLATILDVLQAQVSWIQLYTNSIRAHFDFAVAVSDYRRITAQEQ